MSETVECMLMLRYGKNWGWNGLPDLSRSGIKVHILLNYVENTEDNGCTGRKSEAHLIAGV